MRTEKPKALTADVALIPWTGGAKRQQSCGWRLPPVVRARSVRALRGDGLLAGLEAVLMDEFGFQGAPEAQRIVVNNCRAET